MVRQRGETGTASDVCSGTFSMEMNPVDNVKVLRRFGYSNINYEDYDKSWLKGDTELDKGGKYILVEVSPFNAKAIPLDGAIFGGATRNSNDPVSEALKKIVEAKMQGGEVEETITNFDNVLEEDRFKIVVKVVTNHHSDKTLVVLKYYIFAKQFGAYQISPYKKGNTGGREMGEREYTFNGAINDAVAGIVGRYRRLNKMFGGE